MIVQKYGGTSLGDKSRIEAVADHILSSLTNHKRILVVVSAMGDHTNALLAEAHSIHPAPPSRELDLLLSAGERISMALLSMAIAARGGASRSFTGSQSGIITDETHGDARILKVIPHRILRAFEQVPIVIVAGFQGVSSISKDVTTLGRGGSDLTAIALASELRANSCELYKDVDGVYSGDPHRIANARKIGYLSWEQMSQLSWCGANVIHGRAVDLAAKQNLSFWIKSSFNPTKSGTLISCQLSEPKTPPNSEAPIRGFIALTRLNHLVLVTAEMAPIAFLNPVLEQNVQPLMFKSSLFDGKPTVLCCMRQKDWQTINPIFGSISELRSYPIAMITCIGNPGWGKLRSTRQKLFELYADIKDVTIGENHVTLFCSPEKLDQIEAYLHHTF